MPEATPAEAPHSAFAELSGRRAILAARLVMGELHALCLFVADISRASTVTAEGAYRSGLLGGDGGSELCVDIWRTEDGRLLEPGPLPPHAGGVEEWVRTGRRPLCGASVCGNPAALE